MPTELWAVHIEGPDDIIACADRAEADQRTKEINDAWETLSRRPDANPELDGRFHAVVIPWEWSALEHTEEVARGDDRWT